MSESLINKNHLSPDQEDGFCGQLLLAMPGIEDPRFSRSVIYVCAHSEEGAMGLIINRPAKSMDFSELMDQVFTNTDENSIQINRPFIKNPSIHIGGPVETGRGFVLHSSDYYVDEHTFPVNENISLTATLDILRAIAAGDGPDQALLALGYAGWAPGQLEDEMNDNGWLNCNANTELIFDHNINGKYERALKEMGIDPTHLVAETGHA